MRCRRIFVRCLAVVAVALPGAAMAGGPFSSEDSIQAQDLGDVRGGFDWGNDWEGDRLWDANDQVDDALGRVHGRLGDAKDGIHGGFARKYDGLGRAYNRTMDAFGQKGSAIRGGLGEARKGAGLGLGTAYRVTDPIIQLGVPSF